ncbi:glycosyltransferase [Clostridium sp. VAP41]|uniref:glycosyltransferase n=1 Tax=Clostridium sp. VAP41 TaxID=2949979 RepID=UPI0020797602|nr:glycosyltransferase [Clostridium sp. VAP41]
MIKEPTYISSVKHGVINIGNSVILQGVTIGDGAIIATGSVVNKDIEANTVVAGVTAKLKKGLIIIMIPKVIHYCWFGGKALPSLARKCIKSWEKYCPDYEIIEWNECNFDFNCNLFVKSAYESGNWAFVSDYARLKIIYENGGIYFDTDVEVIRNIDSLLDNECFVGVQQMERLINTGLGFGAEANNKIIKSMLNEYKNITFCEKKKMEFACPYLNTLVFNTYGFNNNDDIQEIKGTKIYPPRYFDPIAPGKSENLKCDDTFSIHHYSASWTPTSQRIKRKIAILIGGERIIKIKRLFGL